MIFSRIWVISILIYIMLHSSGITASRFFFFLLCSNLVNASRIVKLIFNRSFTCSSLLSCRLVFSFAYTCSCLELVLKIFWMLYSFLAWLKESYCTLLLHLAKCQSLLWGAYWKGNRQQAQVTARQFQTDTMKKKIFTVTVIKQWNRLPRQVVESLSFPFEPWSIWCNWYNW